MSMFPPTGCAPWPGRGPSTRRSLESRVFRLQGDRDHVAAPCIVVEDPGPMGRPSHLERACGLEVLRLEEDQDADSL